MLSLSGITIEKQMTKVDGRVLDAPKVNWQPICNRLLHIVIVLHDDCQALNGLLFAVKSWQQ